MFIQMFTVKLLIQKLCKLYPVFLRNLPIYGILLTLKIENIKKVTNIYF